MLCAYKTFTNEHDLCTEYVIFIFVTEKFDDTITVHLKKVPSDVFGIVNPNLLHLKRGRLKFKLTAVRGVDRHHRHSCNMRTKKHFKFVFSTYERICDDGDAVKLSIFKLLKLCYLFWM